MSEDRATPDNSSDDFMAGRALAMRGDEWGDLLRRGRAPPPPAEKAPAPPPPPPTDQPIGQRILSTVSGIAATQEAEAEASRAMAPAVTKLATEGIAGVTGLPAALEAPERTTGTLAQRALDPEGIKKAINVALAMGPGPTGEVGAVSRGEAGDYLRAGELAPGTEEPPPPPARYTTESDHEAPGQYVAKDAAGKVVAVGDSPEQATQFAQLREGAAAPAAPGEPPLAPGMVRLYRGETAAPGGTVPDWVKETPDYQATVAATGRWFGPDLESAQHYAAVHGEDPSRISYVDVPAQDVQKYLAANQPEAKAFSAAGRENEEYFVPPEIAAARKPLAPAEAGETVSSGAPAAITPPATGLAALQERLRERLTLGNPMEPNVTLRAPSEAEQAMADVTLERMPGEGVPPSMMSEEQIHDYLGGARLDNPVKVNLARIGSGDDIAETLAAVSKTIPAQAVQTNEATRYAADALGLTPEAFLDGYRGAQLNAAETTAMRFMLDSSAQQLVELAQKVRGGGEADAAAFAKGFSVHRALQQYMENARAEAGRTLQSWSIMSQQRDVYGRAISQLVASAGDDIAALAGKIADLSPLEAGRLVASSSQGTARDVMLNIAYNAWLSSPTTLVKKISSDIGMAMWNLATRGLAETAGRVGMGSGEIVPGETASLAYGYINSLTDALRAGGKALAAGRSQFHSEFATQEQPFRLSALANGYPAPLEADAPSKAMFDYIRPFFPTSWIAGADDFAKVWQYRAQLRALAWRSAEGDPERFAQLLEAPPQALHQQAMQGALESTFQEPLTGAAAALRDVADKVNIPVPGIGWQIPVGRVIVPFLKVPVNIARTAYRSSPLPVAFPSPAVKAIMANPGAQRDLLMAQMGLGTAVDTALVGLALNGNITGRGPTDPGLNREWQAAGNQPYSLQLPGARPIQLNQIEPFGQHFATIADTINLMKFAKDEDNEHLALSLGFGIGNAMLSKTYFEGMANFLDAMTHPDQDADRYASNLVAGFVPTGLQRLGKANDDWQRAHYGILQSVESNLPMLRENLPPARSLWGDPIPVKDAYLPFLSGTGIAEMTSPVNLGKPPVDAEPIDKWIWDHHMDFANPDHGIAKPPRNLSFDAGPKLSIPVELNAKQYDRFVEQAGNGLKDPANGLGAKDMLNALVEGRGPAGEQRAWDEASPGEQSFMVETIVHKYREAAKAELWQPHNGQAADFPELTDAITAAAGQRASALAGR